MDHETINKITFGPDGVEPLLGVIALENAGFIVHSINNTLRKIRARSLKAVA